MHALAAALSCLLLAAPADEVVWDCDLSMTYEHTPLWRYLDAAPALAFVADGSPVQVFPGTRLKLPAEPALATATEIAIESMQAPPLESAAS